MTIPWLFPESESRGIMLVKTHGIKDNETIRKVRNLIRKGVPEYLDLQIVPEEIITSVEIFQIFPNEELEKIKGEVNGLRVDIGVMMGMLKQLLREKQ